MQSCVIQKNANAGDFLLEFKRFWPQKKNNDRWLKFVNFFLSKTAKKVHMAIDADINNWGRKKKSRFFLILWKEIKVDTQFVMDYVIRDIVKKLQTHFFCIFIQNRTLFLLSYFFTIIDKYCT